MRHKLRTQWTNHQIGLSVALSLLGFLLVMAIQFSFVTYENRRIAYTLDSDGPYQADRLQKMLERGIPFAEGFYNYGNTQHFFAFIVAKVIRLATGENNEFYVSALSLQIVQLAFGSAGAVALYFLGKDLTKSRSFSLASLTLLFMSPAFFFWFYQLHPDIIQLALIILFVFFLHFRNHRFSLYLSGLCLGLAIGAKYQAGLFVVFFLVWAIVSAGSLGGGKLRFAKIFSQSRNFLFATSVGFFVPNFSIFIQPFEFIKDISYEASHVNYGHDEEASRDMFLWLPIIFGEAFLLLVLIGLLLVIGIVSRGIRDLTFGMFSEPLGLASLVTVVLGVGHLLFFVNYREPRFFIYLMVPLLVLLFLLFRLVVSGLRLPSFLSAGPWKLVLPFVAVALLVPNFQSLIGRIDSAPHDERLVAGLSLLEECSKDVPVLLPIYSYAPPEFQNIVGEFGYSFTQDDIDDSDVLVLNNSVPGRHIWVDGEIIVRGHLDVSSGQYLLFEPVFRGTTDFERFFESEKVLIFIRTTSPYCGF